MLLEWDITVPDTKSVFTVKSGFFGDYNIKSLKKSFEKLKE